MRKAQRDFYFAKLRDIKILCQRPELENVPMAMRIKKLLYDVDEKEYALAEAQEIVSQSTNVEEIEFSDDYD
ncbi:microtubule-associated protein rp/eb family member 1a [Phtheirospermum japonicum]|uniref:Microtubule-associated protein rp/eb family member 1a n=1 Tax=Phtheirospermum japonicum TaxID=374723 RepID=A0A830CKR2_9LAMI|nr:microtubule-associated protein rp/eb family member 1a [Phtheirospermum japonicum]